MRGMCIYCIYICILDVDFIYIYIYVFFLNGIIHELWFDGYT